MYMLFCCRTVESDVNFVNLTDGTFWPDTYVIHNHRKNETTYIEFACVSRIDGILSLKSLNDTITHVSMHDSICVLCVLLASGSKPT